MIKRYMTRLRWLALPIATLLVATACAEGTANPDGDDPASEDVGEDGDQAGEPEQDPAGEDLTSTEGEPEEDVEEAAPTGEMTDVGLQFPNTSASISLFPFYIADDRGYYEENGLSVEFLYGPGSASAIQQLIAGNADIAMTTPGAVLDAALQGFDVRWIYQHFYFNRFEVAVPEGSDVQSMEELEGQAVGISDAAGGEVPTVRGSIAAAGLEEDTDVEIIPVGEGAAAVQAIETDVVAALGVSKPDVLTLQLAGLELRPVTPDVVGTFPGDGVAVTPQMLEDNPEMVESFVRATLQGWAWAQANPDATYDIIKELYAPEQLVDDEFGRGFPDINLEDTSTPSELNENQHGQPLLDSWTANAEFFYDIGILTDPVDVEPILVDDVVSAVWEEGIDLEEVRADAAAYQP